MHAKIEPKNALFRQEREREKRIPVSGGSDLSGKIWGLNPNIIKMTGIYADLNPGHYIHF